MVIFIVGGWLFASIVIGSGASSKGLNGITWTLVSLFFSPIVGWMGAMLHEAPNHSRRLADY